jgi:hypothetical protein
MKMLDPKRSTMGKIRIALSLCKKNLPDNPKDPAGQLLQGLDNKIESDISYAFKV